MKIYLHPDIVMKFPGFSGEIIYNSGHLIPLEQPDVFNEVALKFFEKH